jgi:hypothetical protein
VVREEIGADLELGPELRRRPVREGQFVHDRESVRIGERGMDRGPASETRVRTFGRRRTPGELLNLHRVNHP